MQQIHEKNVTHPAWSFITNHTHVLVCIHKQNHITARELSQKIGITERSVQRIISDLLQSDVIERAKQGRNNSYTINWNHKLHHPLEEHHTIKELLDILA